MSEENLTRTGALHSKHTLTELRGFNTFPSLVLHAGRGGQNTRMLRETDHLKTCT